jgi:CheY-like chemotaxis protein
LTLLNETAGEHHKTTTVLLVEDESSLLEFFSTILRREGYEVITAQNGVEALEIVKGQDGDQIDILFTDVAMPYIGGVQLGRACGSTGLISACF